ncbi:uncharacterized protein LOC115444189 [Manduca sexta]|uniref:Uncharacterized protein n=1 Tax=Manduca sexta TaxID=7130 RepID=A0A922CMT5_MANSE|nr:uncharacterized protein LOC115444189 [Manduca sexta]KAG6451143.1 hypothetical protein O3G_MSEX006949 [Manduca sexta]
MLRPCILFLFIYSATAIRYKPKPVHMIAIKDHVFVGEDPKIKAELARRLGSDKDNHAYFKGNDDYNKTDLPDYLIMDEQIYLNRSLRRQNIFNDPKEYHINFKILDMIRQAIYATQFRLDVLDKILVKYINEEKFRVGYMFGKLEEWLHNMKSIWTVVWRTRVYYSGPKARQFRVYKHLLYYAHMLRRNIDITYTVEEIIRIHNEIYTSIKSEEKD